MCAGSRRTPGQCRFLGLNQIFLESLGLLKIASGSASCDPAVWGVITEILLSSLTPAKIVNKHMGPSKHGPHPHSHMAHTQLWNRTLTYLHFHVLDYVDTHGRFTLTLITLILTVMIFNLYIFTYLWSCVRTTPPYTFNMTNKENKDKKLLSFVSH